MSHEYVTEDQRRRERLQELRATYDERKAAAEAAAERYREIDPIEAQYIRTNVETGEVEIDERAFEAGVVRNVPAWHDKALIWATDVEGELTPTKVMEQVPTIASPVVKRPLSEYGLDLPSKFVTVRELDGKPLGIVGSRYHVIQQEEAFGILGDLVDSGELVIESALTYDGGASVAIQARLPEDVEILSEKHIPWLLWSNNHSGKGQAQVDAGPERAVCRNTVRVAKANAAYSYKIRHTANAGIKLAEAREALGIVFKYTESLKEDADVLAGLKLNMNQFNRFLGELVPVPEPEYTWNDKGELVQSNKRTITNATKLQESIFSVYNEDNLNDIRGTGWGVFQAVVEHEEHHKRYKNPDRRMQAVLDVPDLTQEAFERMMEMATS